MSHKLVIVESPNKVKSIQGYLGAGYEVAASVGHIRDLAQPSELPEKLKKGPFAKFAVDVDHGFTPYYVTNADKKKTVTALKKLLKDADELLLATDDDREGEAIAWHLLEVLKPKVPVRRMTFTEITKEAVTRALDNTRELDKDRVDAQETRRILDRLVGYEVSPVLWRKVRPHLSAGRVQSVATRLVVERERERMAFTAAHYWGVEADFSLPGQVDAAAHDSFTARLTGLDDRRVATGRDFDDSGALKAAATRASVVHLHEGGARAIAEAVASSHPDVTALDEKPYRRRPAAPFTTSTLQQEASRKLRLNPRDTMRVAQGLYEGGYITYMRTDSTMLSEQALTAARSQAAQMYGPEYVADKPRVYANKNRGAQEAHEAIRPAGDHFRTPAQVAGQLHGSAFKLYELIWKRTVASQMADAVGSTATVTVTVPLTMAGASRDSGLTFSRAQFTASGTVITFRGFMAAYEEGRDADRYDDSSAKKDARLPVMSVGQSLVAGEATAAGHDTTPPPRYTEASLVKALEEREIGRPSTYAATMSTITDRGYVEHRGQSLVPTWLAFAVTRLLEENFADLVDYDFTASMEADLDEIAAGREDHIAWLTRFYFGPEQAREHRAATGTATGQSRLEQSDDPGLKTMVDNLGDIDAREVNSIPVGEGITLRVGRYGPYLENEAGERANVPDGLAPDELTVEKARELYARAADDGRELGVDPATGHTIIAKDGRYGPYVSEVLPEPAETEAAEEGAQDAAPKRGRGRKAAAAKPRTASLFASMSLSEVTLEQALMLLSLPRVVGTDPESGTEITAQNGRFGPYLKKGTDSRSLESEDAIFSTTLEQALEIFAQPKRRGRTARPPLRELGTDPASGKPVVIKDGRFGPYATDGETNATLRRGDDPSTMTPERAYELLAEKRAKGPAKKRTTRKTSTAKKSTATKKTAAKKTTAKKTSTKASAAKGSAAASTAAEES